ncbi:MAG: TonB-dependent receptor [Gemmatimonadota bacterium]|nr:TonB-dependent receptor [Gemmatimonadota bacterium]
MRSIYEDLAGLMRLLGPAALSLVLVGSLVVGQEAWSEEAEEEDEEAYTEDIYLMEEAIVVGSRHAPRSEKESAAPVDVLNADELRTQAAVDMDDMLRTLAPSYNIQRHGIDDEATLVRPATLRGLPPDNLLVLVNGKRRHRSGVIALLGSSLNTGSQGPDLSVIPAIALTQMELLRDGAAAQYGSDAIAGVLNLRLREASEGVLVETRAGQYFEGDGRLSQAAANVGLPLTEDGFFNVSVEYRQSDPTIRSGQRANAATLRERGYPVEEPAQIWGSPDLDGVWNTFFNSGVDLGNGAEAYSFGGWAKRRAEGGFFFRAPGTSSARSSVFRIGDQRAVADLDPNDDVDPANLEVPSLDSSFDETQAFVDEYQGDLFLFNERFPGGFTPRFGADILDMSLVAGLRSVRSGGLKWDASVSAARSNIEFFIFNTINASLGPDTPTSFRPRDYIQTEVAANLDFSYAMEVGGLASPLGLAWGAEWRQETFESVAGDESSYVVGRFAAQGFSSGSNGYQGLHPSNAGKWDRPNYALYVDLQADVVPQLQLGTAVRYEDFYADFGNTLNGKLSALLRASDRVNLRSTVSTGFRAPSPGQANLRAVTTGFSGTGGLTEQGQVPPTHPIAAALGGEELTEEKSVGFSVGTAMELTDDFDVTLDYFAIAIEDRIALTGNIKITDQIAAIIRDDESLQGVSVLQEVKFFSNDFDTRTQGIDLVLSWTRTWDTQSLSHIDVAYNWTRTTLEDFSQVRTRDEFLGKPLDESISFKLMTPRREVELEEMNPEHRLVLTGSHQMGAWNGMLRPSYFSAWKACRFQDNSCGDLDAFDGGVIVDAEVGYTFADSYQLSVGAQNILDSVPEAAPEETAGQGNLRPESTPWDYNGAFWYTRLFVEF